MTAWDVTRMDLSLDLFVSISIELNKYSENITWINFILFEKHKFRFPEELILN